MNQHAPDALPAANPAYVGYPRQSVTVVLLSCYHLFYEPGIVEFQGLAPDLFFASRAWQ